MPATIQCPFTPVVGSRLLVKDIANAPEALTHPWRIRHNYDRPIEVEVETPFGVFSCLGRLYDEFRDPGVYRVDSFTRIG